VLDLKPYVPYADAFPEARAGWVDETIPSVAAERSDPGGWGEP
jgi:tRNA (Thr-GGU) A37 N-methylase